MYVSGLMIIVLINPKYWQLHIYLELILYFIMLEFTQPVEQDFLNRKQVQKLLDAGIDMSDAKYFLFKRINREYLGLKNECTFGNNAIPTYSVGELARKMNVAELDGNYLVRTLIKWNKK